MLVRGKGLPVLRPGQCISVLPKDAPPPHLRTWEDLWFAVYLRARSTRQGCVYLKVAWFYNKEQALTELKKLAVKKHNKQYVCDANLIDSINGCYD